MCQFYQVRGAVSVVTADVPERSLLLFLCLSSLTCLRNITVNMSGRRKELHRFRPGESCDECRARKYYDESGFRYCENGHQIEASLLSNNPHKAQSSPY